MDKAVVTNHECRRPDEATGKVGGRSIKVVKERTPEASPGKARTPWWWVIRPLCTLKLKLGWW